MKVVDFDGMILDATFSVQPSNDGTISVIFESSGGHEGGPNPRNLQYREGLNVILRRLQLLGAVLVEIRVETTRTRLLPVDQQRIINHEHPFPVALSSVHDIDVFRQQISRYGRKIGQSSDLAAEGGGSSRRLRIFLTGVPNDQSKLEMLLTGEGIETDEGVVPTVITMAAGRSRNGGQGFLISHTVRKTIEVYAVAGAISYYEAHGWTVQDVGSSECYDLRCTCESSTRELHVEVKGTTGLGETIILTRNEVRHAREWPHVDLFVMTNIVIDGRDTNHPVPGGGIAQLCPNWKPIDEDLIPLGYDYFTGLAELNHGQRWTRVTGNGS